MTVLLILCLGGFWAFLLWRVRVEEGWVGRPPTPLEIAMRQLARQFRAMEEAIARALLPAVRRAAESMAALVAARKQLLDPSREPDL